jgi:hypothetical protein
MRTAYLTDMSFEPLNDSTKRWVAPAVRRGLINPVNARSACREGAAPSPTTKSRPKSLMVFLVRRALTSDVDYL